MEEANTFTWENYLGFNRDQFISEFCNGGPEIRKKLKKRSRSYSSASQRDVSPTVSTVEPVELKNVNNSSHTFNDGVRSIDYVLVWEASSCSQQRKTFELDLENKFELELEYDAPDDPDNLHFVKIHIPVAVVRRFSEVLKIRMPLKAGRTLDALTYVNLKYVYVRQVRTYQVLWKLSGQMHFGCVDVLQSEASPVKRELRLSKNIFRYYWDILMSSNSDSTVFPRKEHHLTAIYSKDKEYLFDTTSEFSSPLVRLRIIQYILDRAKYDDGNLDFGISRLLSHKIYSAAYPLHDGDLKTPGSMRYKLNTEWASLYKCFKFQPLDYIKDYFGVKIGLYYAWLGFYTMMLIPASMVGLMCFKISMAKVHSYEPSVNICKFFCSIITFCPTCDGCDYWNMCGTCKNLPLQYLFNNWSTVFFAGFMNVWAITLLALWRRYSAEISHRWNLTGFDLYDEHPRPQYIAELSRKKWVRTQINCVTGYIEPVASFWRIRLPATLFSYSVVTLLLILVLVSVLGVVFYRMSLSGANFVAKLNIPVDTNVFTQVSAATINLVFINMIGYVYQRIARWLTEKELLRTQSEFEDSLTFKIYILQFVNYYSSIFYIAFFKGKFVGKPGNYIRFFNQRQLECPPGGCFLELSIQLTVIMIGNQIKSTVKEISTLYFIMRWKSVCKKRSNKDTNGPLQYKQDYMLLDFGDMGLFQEYNEMVCQFGFITIFVVAFPLAPLIALISNMLEIRFDAKKFLHFYRRPVPSRVKDIGVWYKILRSIIRLSVITNSLIIAFTSDIIPQFLYEFEKDDSLINYYVYTTFATFSTAVLERPPINSTKYSSLSHCRYPNHSFYEPTEPEEKARFWKVMALRMFFVVAFQNATALVMVVIKWAIPSMPRGLREHIQRESFVTNKLILEHSHPICDKTSQAAHRTHRTFRNKMTANKKHRFREIAKNGL